ncbi:MAG: DUF4269 domain-containing protein [Pedobacter sp.]|uniref:DUF4269 domain-containing protein n=1 Tax=Pedobacter sp. TaxID=1411316 RepID=UPI00280760F0|nr:DUF4269 domain-containing protein [Pedobacter sp.]MDQ8004659.1 DUF4269 domain-containing protein [Pedobacter sp.]
MDFLTIEYLKNGNERQKSAYQTLVTHQLFEKLKPYNPILTGTIPIHIDIETSDLDIICYWEDKQEFVGTLKRLFKLEKDFQIRDMKISDQDSVVCSFKVDDIEVEVFGQNIPTQQQNAYRHMLIEHQILQEKGEDFRLKIIELKQKGFKTEPAFAELLELKGNPYKALLKLPAIGN